MTERARGDRRWIWMTMVRALLACIIAATTACGGASGADAADGRVPASAKASRSPAPAADSVVRRTVVFAGTSLTAGLGLDPDSAFPQLVARKIDSAGLPFEVVNAGVSGETTAGLLRRLDWLLEGKFDVLVIESGANDGLRGTPPATVRRNLAAIVERVRAAHPTTRVVLVQMEAPPNLGGAYASAFRAVYPAVAKEAGGGVTLIPFLLDRVAGVTSLNQADGIHPNIVGERMVAENVWRSLEPVLREVAGAPVHR